MDDFVVNKEDNGGEHVTFTFLPEQYSVEIDMICYGNHHSKIGFTIGSDAARELAMKLIEFAAACDAETAEDSRPVETPTKVRRRPRKGFGAL
jgi:hypothetical protein